MATKTMMTIKTLDNALGSGNGNECNRSTNNKQTKLYVT